MELQVFFLVKNRMKTEKSKENNMAYKPTGHHVVVRPDKVEEKSKGGIYIPISTKDQEQRAVTKGEIVAIGPNAAECYMTYRNEKGDVVWLKVGDRVCFSKYGGELNPLRDGDESLRLLNDEDILAEIDS